MFTLNEPRYDWITLTTFSQQLGIVFLNTAKEWGARSSKSKRMQYEGWISHDKGGTFFAGKANQRGKNHWMAQISGDASNQAIKRFYAPIEKGLINVTRLDIQITVEMPLSWSQPNLFRDLRSFHNKKAISYLESNSSAGQGKLATVYIGSRSSDRVVRIYEKLGYGDEIFLRFEVEFKKQRALNATLAGIDLETRTGILRHEIERLKNDDIRTLFASVFDVTSNPIVVVREQSQTARWLKRTVFPSLRRFLNDHNQETDEIYNLFKFIMTEYEQHIDRDKD